MSNILINLVLFKAGWVACILFAARGEFTLSVLAMAVVVTAHLLRVPVAIKEAAVLLGAVGMGLVWESLLVTSGLLSYPGASGQFLAPIWIVAMWALFATTINHGLSWVKRWWVYAALAGGIGGPMAFWAGASAGAVTFSNTWLALGVIGIGWAILLPALALLADTIVDSTLLEPADDLPVHPGALLQQLQYHA